jgi:Concanavalin A-like lectin/glucanases superfamily
MVAMHTPLLGRWPAFVGPLFMCFFISLGCAQGVELGPPSVGHQGGTSGGGGVDMTGSGTGGSGLGGSSVPVGSREVAAGGASGAGGSLLAGDGGSGGSPETDGASANDEGGLLADSGGGMGGDGSDGGAAGGGGATGGGGAAGGGGTAGGGGGPTDGCPNDPAKAAPGICGCGVPESCVELKNALVHRYRFLGSGTQATDSVGTAHGKIVNTTLSGSGTVVLAGGTSDQYVDLPNDLVHTLGNATFEAWITWQGGNAWQRIFDFGDEQTQTENAQGIGRSYLFVSATLGGANGMMRCAYQKAGSTETIVSSVKSLPTGAMSHVAVVANDQNNKLAIYLNGSLESEATWNDSLSSIHDINVWLGRSQYAVDPELGATYHEFRIYSVALTAAQLALSAQAGPDPAFLN